ncbi:uncharacterized protein CEXT_532391 [Caerostris extrusa]|uniref:Uncharacterized protein n=1 Tax=Caerostris extrusa TaxID=172846 RepID=A0AAV4MTL7_CAEEX|nr:uncharacterized protein CEXT_532391 [Caerostris extrusa]
MEFEGPILQLLTLEPQAQRSGEEGGVGCGNSRNARDLSTGLRRRPASMESSTCASETNPLGSSKLCTEILAFISKTRRNYRRKADHIIMDLVDIRLVYEIMEGRKMIIFVCCFLFVVINEIVLLQEALGRTTTINSINKDMKAGREEDPGYFPEYPVITVCRKPLIRQVRILDIHDKFIHLNSSYLEMVEYIFLTLGFPMVSLTPRELSHVVQMAAYANDYSSKLEPDTLVFKKKLEELENKFQALKNQEEFNLTNFILKHSIE